MTLKSCNKHGTSAPVFILILVFSVSVNSLVTN